MPVFAWIMLAEALRTSPTFLLFQASYEANKSHSRLTESSITKGRTISQYFFRYDLINPVYELFSYSGQSTLSWRGRALPESRGLYWYNQARPGADWRTGNGTGCSVATHRD